MTLFKGFSKTGAIRAEIASNHSRISFKGLPTTAGRGRDERAAQ